MSKKPFIRRLLATALSFTFLVTIFINPALAKPTNNTSPPVATDHIAANEKFHRSSHTEKVKALKAVGLSQSDAEYYATVDDKIVELENQKKTIDLTDVKAISFEEMAADPAQFRAKVLNLDPAAMKAALAAFESDMKQNDMDKLIKQHPGQRAYEIQFPTGNKIHFETSPVELISPPIDTNDQNKVIPQSEYIYWQEYTGGDGTFTNKYTWWAYSNPAVYWKLEIDNVKFTVDNNYSELISYTNRPAVVSGALRVDFYEYNSPDLIGYSNVYCASAYNHVIFKATSAFTITDNWDFPDLSLNTNNKWEEGVDFRIYGNGLMQGQAIQGDGIYS